MKIYVASTNNQDVIHMFFNNRFGFQFVESVHECDIVLVLHRTALKERLNTLDKPAVFFSMEPNESWRGSENFLSQFDLVISSDTNFQENNCVIHPSYTSWLLNKLRVVNGKHFLELSRDHVIDDCQLNSSLNDRICLVSSGKDLSEGHQRRLRILSAIGVSAKLSPIVDIYGYGFKSFEMKYDVLRNYRYVIVIENEEKSDYWTEKIADSLILGQVIFYIGCDNIKSYFHEENVTYAGWSESIDYYIAKIEEWSVKGRFRRCDKVLVDENRRRVLEDYSLLGLLARYRDNIGCSRATEIKPNYEFSDSYIRSLVKRIYFKLFSRKV